MHDESEPPSNEPKPIVVLTKSGLQLHFICLWLNLAPEEDDQEIELDVKGALYKRKDFLDKEDAGLLHQFFLFALRICKAKTHPNRAYYYRKFSNVDKLIEDCTAKVLRYIGAHA